VKLGCETLAPLSSVNVSGAERPTRTGSEISFPFSVNGITATGRGTTGTASTDRTRHVKAIMASPECESRFTHSVDDENDPVLRGRADARGGAVLPKPPSVDGYVGRLAVL
jgi:hypothetical protein